MLKTVFFGTPEFSLKSLEATYKNSELKAVVTQPDRPRGRGLKLSPCEVKAWALEKNIPVFSPESLKRDSEEKTRLLSFLQKEKPDLFMVTAYGLIFPKNFLDLPKQGAFNVHASLLPRWRGAAPIQRALESGDLKTGVCLQKMVFELDAGDVFSSQEIAIRKDYDAISLAADLSVASYVLVADFFKNFASLTGLPQNPSGVTFAEKIKKEESHWKKEWTASQLENRVRAFAAWPRVSFTLEGVGEVKILNAARVPGHPCGEASSIWVDAKTLQAFLATGSPAEAVELLRIQLPGKAPCRAYDYFQNLESRTKLRAL